MVIAGLLPVTGSLTSLNLSSNNLTNCLEDSSTGITALADALRANGSLTSIYLSGNHWWLG
jgi:hypothetical protein